MIKTISNLYSVFLKTQFLYLPVFKKKNNGGELFLLGILLKKDLIRYYNNPLSKNEFGEIIKSLIVKVKLDEFTDKLENDSVNHLKVMYFLDYSTYFLLCEETREKFLSRFKVIENLDLENWKSLFLKYQFPMIVFNVNKEVIHENYATDSILEDWGSRIKKKIIKEAVESLNKQNIQKLEYKSYLMKDDKLSLSVKGELQSMIVNGALIYVLTIFKIDRKRSKKEIENKKKI